MKAVKLAQLKAHSASIYTLAPGRQAGTLFSAGADKVVAEWDLTKHETNPFAIRTEHTVYSLLNLKRKQLVIGTVAGSMHVIDLASKKEVRHLKFHDKGIFHQNYIESKNMAIAACADGSISVWNCEDWSLLRHLKLSQDKIRRIAIHPNENLIAVACGDGFLRLLETSEFKMVHEMHGHNEGANSIMFLPNGDLLSGGKDAHLCLWDSNEGYDLKQKVPAHNFAIYDIVGPQDGSFIATASRDKTVKIWNPADLSAPTRLDRLSAGGHLNSVNAALWLEDEKVLATCGDDRSIILWDININAKIFE